MFIRSPKECLSPNHRKIFTPIKEPTVSTSLKSQSFSDQKFSKPIFSEPLQRKSPENTSKTQESLTNLQKSRGLIIHSPYSPTKGSLLYEEPCKKIRILQTPITDTEETDRKTGRSIDFQANNEVLKKFNILLERNETLNEVLERKIRKLQQSSQENNCLSQEIEFLQRKNAEFQFELETSKAKIAVLEEEVSHKRKEDIQKNDIINEFKLLIDELEKEMILIREGESENKAISEKNKHEFERILAERISEIEELKKEAHKKKRLEDQLLIFIQENEKIRKVLEFLMIFLMFC